jgi:CRISPR-associated protein Cmr2
LGGSELVFHDAFPTANYAEERFQVCQPGSELDQLEKSKRSWANFFLHWRRWPTGAAEIDYRTLFLPADTRMPDHNVWTHNSVVSALETCVDEKGELRPALLLFQLGPVQNFIAQARSTRDLWSGSYLLSWLAAHALKAVTDRIGPDSVIYPALRAQPLFDVLHRDVLYEGLSFASSENVREETLWQRMGMHERTVEILTPNLPNRFLALVPAEKGEVLAKDAESAVHEELQEIARACWDWLCHEDLKPQDEWKQRFFKQIELFPAIAWQFLTWPTDVVWQALESFERLDPRGAASQSLRAIYRLATEIVPAAHRDKRCFGSGNLSTELNNQGFCWPYYYSLTDWLLAGRRHLRDFHPWKTDDHQFGAVKDSFSGLEEVIGSEEWWESLRTSKPHLFRSQDRLGAVNLVKRTWHLAYLESKWSLNVKRALRFESVPGVAAGQWRQSLLEKVEERKEAWHGLIQLKSTLTAQADVLRKSDRIVADAALSEKRWLEATNPDCFLPSTWDQLELEGLEDAKSVLQALRKFYEKAGISSPPSYYAVLALDGDEMGKWVSGQNTPPFLQQLSRSASKYFKCLTVDQEMLNARRPLSPSYHLQFSEALANFGLYLAGPIVDHFGGQLIYSGGDDVLAMVPAITALRCAEALRSAFKGDPRLEALVPQGFEVLGTNGGFVRLVSEQSATGQPTWPLIVPGPNAECSVGIAIGHMRSPLQGLIQAAHRAQQRAKSCGTKYDFGRAACVISLYKRSGEILEWGFKWKSRAIDLFEKFAELSSGEDPPLSSRFGYALHALLRPYAPAARGAEPVVEDLPEFDAKTVLLAELSHVLSRQWHANLAGREKKRAFEELCRAFIQDLEKDGRPLMEDFPRLFDTANFILRGEA